MKVSVKYQACLYPAMAVERTDMRCQVRGRNLLRNKSDRAHDFTCIYYSFDCINICSMLSAFIVRVSNQITNVSHWLQRDC